MPEQHGAVQGGEDIPYGGSCVAILQPALLNGPPQFIGEPETFGPLRFWGGTPSII